jgi:hypothetical protein
MENRKPTCVLKINFILQGLMRYLKWIIKHGTSLLADSSQKTIVQLLNCISVVLLAVCLYSLFHFYADFKANRSLFFLFLSIPFCFFWFCGSMEKKYNISKHLFMVLLIGGQTMGSAPNKHMAFSDLSFDGKEATVSVYVYRYKAPVFDRKEYYLYQQSLGQFYYKHDDPFAEPVQVFSNIENGHGIFAAYSVNKFSVLEGI